MAVALLIFADNDDSSFMPLTEIESSCTLADKDKHKDKKDAQDVDLSVKAVEAAAAATNPATVPSTVEKPLSSMVLQSGRSATQVLPMRMTDSSLK